MDQKLPKTESKVSSLFSAVFLCLFSLPFAGFGLVAAYKGAEHLLTGKTKDGLFLCLFGLIFSGIGFGIIFAAIFGSRLQKRADAMKAAHPDEPWLWRKEWTDGIIKSSAQSAMFGAWCIAGFWNLVSSGVFFAMADPKNRHKPGLYLALIFPLVGIGLLVWAIRETIEWWKFGQSTFKMLAVPGVIGGQVSGAIETSVKIKPKDGFHVKLSCVRRIVTGSGKNSSTSESIIWQQEKTMVKELLDDDPRRTGIPVAFRIPGGAAESDDRNPRDRTIWRLEARAEVPGVDYLAKFEVPVFRTAESAAATSEDPALAYEAPEQPFKLPVRSRIRIRPLLDGGAEFYFPPARNPGMLFFTTVFFLTWTGATTAAYLLFKSVFFEIVFTLVDVLLAFLCFNLWFKSSRVTINSSSVRITSHWLFMGPTRTYDARDVAGFEAKGGTQYGQTMFYNLQLRTNGGKRITAANYVPGNQEADWLCEQMSKALPR